MPLRLRVIPSAGLKPGDERGPTTERIVEFPDDADEIRIGRRADIELSLPFKALSGLHARLVRKKTATGERGNTWVLEDLDSKNGTFIGKDRIGPGRQRLMLAGDEVDLAHVRLIFDGHSQSTSGAEGTGTIARRLVNDLFHGSPGASAPTLTVIQEGAIVSTFKLVERDRPYFVGRANDCDLCINREELSRRHASFTRGWNGVVVRDLDSKNGIKINGVRLTAQRLSDGDVVEVGPLELRLMDPEERYLRELDGQPDRLPPPDARAESPAPSPPAAAPPLAAAAPRLSFAKGPAAPAPALRGPAPAPVASRFAVPAKSPLAKGRPSVEVHAKLDEFHPALAARRLEVFGEPQPAKPDDRANLNRSRAAMVVALLVLGVIAAVALVMLFGSSE